MPAIWGWWTLAKVSLRRSALEAASKIVATLTSVIYPALAGLLLAVSLGVVVRRLGVYRRWLPLAVLLILDLGVPSG